jgi:hypothetical protein
MNFNLQRLFFDQANRWDKSERLLRFKGSKCWKIGDSFESVISFGATGSGKSTGAMYSFTTSVMEAGYGLLIHCSKPSDVQFYLDIAKWSGRENSVVMVGPRHRPGYNILRCEMEATRKDAHGGDMASNVAALLFAIGESLSAYAGTGKNESMVWQQAGLAMTRHAATVVYCATGDLRVSDINDMIDSAPQSLMQVQDSMWRRDSVCFQFLETGAAKHPQNQNLSRARNYFLRDFPTFPNDTRNSVVFTVKAGGLDLFIREPLHSMFFSKTDYSPDILTDGAIIICDSPDLEYGQVGALTNSILRLRTQRMVERRGISELHRPIAIVWDEAQKTMTRTDVIFQESSRSPSCSVIAATQNLPSLKDRLGDNLADAFLGHMKTQIFFQNSDRETGEHMSNRCAKQKEERVSETRSADGKVSRTTHEETNEVLPPYAANNLKTGGPENNYTVTGILTAGGKTIANGLPYLVLKFNQTNVRPWLRSQVAVIARRRPAPDFRYLREGD